METCCQDIPAIACALVDINERTTPLQYTDNTLIIDATLSVEDALTLGGAEISIEDGHINLPAETLINGVPLISSAFETVSLPENTMINGYQPITEHYYYYFMAFEGEQTVDGYIVNGYPNTVGKFSPGIQVQCTYGFSFTAPEDCMLTSLKVLCVLRTPAVNPTPAPTSIFITLDVMDTLENIYYTGVTMEIPSPTPNSRNFVETEFEYPLFKGDAAAVYIVGSTDSLGTITAFATLGYKMLPPPTVLATNPSSKYLHLQPTNEQPAYNRFPFNNIMNTMKHRPVHLEDRLKMMRSPGATREQVYGSILTPYDFEKRLSPLQGIERTKPNQNVYSNLFSKQDIIAFLFCGGKQEGYYIDFSSTDHQDTLELDEKYKWNGVLIGKEPTSRPLTHVVRTDGNIDADYTSILTENNVASFIDYISLDITDPQWSHDTLWDLLSILMYGFYNCGVIIVKHNKHILRIKIDMEIRSLGYTKLFTEVNVGTSETPQLFEEWYVNPALLHPIITKIIKEHPQNTNGINWDTCKTIITEIIRPENMDESLFQTMILDPFIAKNKMESSST